MIYCDATLIFYQLTEIQLRCGRLAEAESAMRRGFDIHPTYQWGHWLLGVVLLAKGDRDAALIEMKRVNVVDGRQLGLARI
jgi:predicted Zn-dependent protease